MRRHALLMAAGLVSLQPGCQNGAPGSRSLTPPTPDPARLAGFAAGDVEAAARLYAIKCAKCHEFYDPGSYPEAEWRSWMAKMATKARLQPDQLESLSRYLDAFRPAAPPIERRGQ